jgi:hypothetical protein
MAARDVNINKRGTGGNRLAENASFLHFICTAATPSQRNQLLKSATADQINAICECAFNILKQNVQLPEKIVTHLRHPRNKKLVYHLADRRTPITKKKNRLVSNLQRHQQVGGFPFLALLKPIIGSLIGAAVSNLVNRR